MEYDDIINDDDDNLDALDIIIYGIPRRVNIRSDHYQLLSDFDFFERYRLTKQTVLNLLIMIEGDLEYFYDVNNCVSPMNQLLICLRIFATGGHLISTGDFEGVHKSTVSRIVAKVSRVLARLARHFIKMPRTDRDITKAQNDFFDIAAFPRVIGVIDCTHIKIQSPGGDDAEIFRNRKSYFSINVQAICNANYEFINIVARWPGSAHDATIFNNSAVRVEFEANVFPNSLLLGDSGYPLRPYLLTPILNPANQSQRLYNEAQIRSRVKIENTFGIWKRRFPILAYGCRLKLETVLHVIVATAVLHNLARRQGEAEPPIDQEHQHRLQQLIANGQIPALPNIENEVDGFDIRNEFVENYFGRI